MLGCLSGRWILDFGRLLFSDVVWFVLLVGMGVLRGRVTLGGM